MIGTSPPGPTRWGSTTCSTKAEATAASKALPPFSYMDMPDVEASQWVVVMTPNVPRISGLVVIIQVLQLNQLSRGSSASRSPSPRRLKPRTTRKIAPPGKTDIHGACDMKFFAVFSIEPQEGLGGCWPRPRNDRLASAMMAVAMVIVACTMIGGRTF